MTYPIPDRVSPSGPLASNNAPWAEYAGKRLVFQDPPETDEVSYIGKIGPSGGALAPTLVLYSLGGGFVPSGNAVGLTPLGIDFGITPGLWLMEADIGCGFNSSVPAQENYGSLNASLGIYLDAGGAPITTGVRTQSPVARSVKVTADAAEVTLQPTRSTKIIIPFELTLAQFQSAGLVPMKSLALQLTRVNTVDANAGQVGPYTNTSGILEFTRDCSLLVRRIG
jgi:hypothetical protein